MNGTLAKRNPEEAEDIPTAKNRRVIGQTGTAERLQEDDYDLCELISAFKKVMNIVELKPCNEPKHDMSRFLRGKTKSIMNHLSKELEEKMVNQRESQICETKTVKIKQRNHTSVASA